MEKSYININIKNLNNNINYLRNNYNYKYFILDVSNNAFNHGIYLINYLKNIDFLYVNNFKDVLLVRKYNKNFPLIYEGELDEDIFYDLVMNDVIIVINDKEILNKIKIKDQVSLILRIDTKDYIGISKKTDILDILDIVKDNKYLNIKGIISEVKEEDYEEFKYLITCLKDLDMVCLNNEEDKNKIKLSNTIKLDYSIYGINKIKKSLFKKEEYPLKQIFTLKTRIIKIKKEESKKKEIILGIIALGYLNGFYQNIKKVIINGNFYDVYQVNQYYSLIIIDEDIKINDEVIITDANNPLENYLDGNILGYLGYFKNNLEIGYDEEMAIY